MLDRPTCLEPAGDPEWRLAVLLSRLEKPAGDDLRTAERLLSGNLPDLKRVERILRRSKTIRLALRHLADLREGLPAVADLYDRLRPQEDEETRWREVALPPMRSAVAAAAASGGRLIKGLAVQNAYPDPDCRHVGDVDVHVPSWPGAASLVRTLRADGWGWDVTEFPWVKWDDTGQLYGQLSLVTPATGDPIARVDLHIGPFSVGHAGVMPLTGWRRARVLGVSIEVADSETSIAILAAHALNDGLLSVKDINDMHVLVNQRAVDWVSVRELCRAVEAEQVLAECVEHTALAYPADRLPAWPPVRSSLLRPEGYGEWQRAAFFARHAYRNERHRGLTVPTASLRAVEALRYFSADLTPRLRRGSEDRFSPADRRRDLCWRLVPAEVWGRWARMPSPVGPVLPTGSSAGRRRERLADGLELAIEPGAAAVVFDRDVFLPTVWGDVSDRSVQLAGELAGVGHD